METLSQKLKSILPLSVLVFLFSFYPFDPAIEVGLDPSYAFGLNYIFQHQIPFGTDVIYTYGPLGFLYFPQDMGSNFLIALLVVSAIRFFFIYAFLTLGRIINPKYWVFHTLLAFVLCSLFYLDFILVGAVSLCLLIHRQKQQKIALYMASLITVMALLIKSSFGLMCGSILFTYLIVDYVRNKNLDNALKLMLSSIISFLLIWILMYRNIAGVYPYLYGTWQLSTGNSSAMILDVSNNWWYISFFILTFFSLPFLMKNKDVSLLYLISFLSLYAAWKYAFSREENYHLKFFLDYLILFSALILVLSKNLNPRFVGILFASILLFSQSMKASGMYTLQEAPSFTGIKNFTELVFNSKQFMEDAHFKSEQNLASKKISAEFLNHIGKKSIDFFPWELTYAAANELNWKPRPNLQSGAYTPWLDKNNANFISSKQGPEFILWEMDKPRGGVDCFDGRYLLNDEPLTIFAIFNKYKLVYSDSSNCLFQRIPALNFPLLIEGDKLVATWNHWIKTPQDTSAVVRIKVKLENNFTGKLRKAIYKDALYFMDLKFADKSIMTYRIVRDNAVNGLWVSPQVQRISDGLTGKRPIAVRFHCSETNLVAESISFQWQIITLAENQQTSKNGTN